MYVLVARECVRVEGRQGLFMVVATNYQGGFSDLIGVSSKEHLTRISFASLFDASDDRARSASIRARVPPELTDRVILAGLKAAR
jgi:hypothetical protein